MRHVYVRLPLARYRELQHRAAADASSVSQLIRTLVVRELDRMQGDRPGDSSGDIDAAPRARMRAGENGTGP